MSVVHKLAGQLHWTLILVAVLLSCGKKPSDLIIGEWELHKADHGLGMCEFFADGICVGRSAESGEPPDTATYIVVGDSIHFTNDTPSHSYLILFESNDRFTIQPRGDRFERVHD